MKRRWWIERDASGWNGHSGYNWYRSSKVAGQPALLVGCVCHHSWTQRVRSFVEVPDA